MPSSFVGGRAEATFFQKLTRNLRNRQTVVNVGFFENATYPDGTYVAMVAAINNFGAPKAGIPPRPFFTNTVRDKQKEWADIVAKLLPRKGYDIDAVFAILGQRMIEDIQEAIKNTGPNNAASTILRKGFDSPLRETMLMLRSVEMEMGKQN